MTATATAAPTTAAPEALPGPAAQLFGPSHRALRHALCGLLSRLGSELLTDPEAARAVVAELEQVLQLCEAHRELEDRFVYPPLAARQRGSLDPFVQAHAEQPRRVAELQALGRTLLETSPARRAAAGHTLALHFSTFTAELLVHMAEEEQLLLPLLVRTFEARELEAMNHRLLASALAP